MSSASASVTAASSAAASGEVAEQFVALRAVHLLAVARYERYGVAVVDEIDYVGGVSDVDAEFLGEFEFDVHNGYMIPQTPPLIKPNA